MGGRAAPPLGGLGGLCPPRQQQHRRDQALVVVGVHRAQVEQQTAALYPADHGGHLAAPHRLAPAQRCGEGFRQRHRGAGQGDPGGTAAADGPFGVHHGRGEVVGGESGDCSF